MQQQVVTHTISVTREDQMQYLQIRLPHNYQRIIGFEYGIIPDIGIAWPPGSTIDPRFQMRANEYFGRLTLHAPGCPGIVYQGEISKDKNMHMAEPVGFRHWNPALWTHARKRTEMILSAPAYRFIEGLYCNMHDDEDPYFVHLYLWVENLDQ